MDSTNRRPSVLWGLTLLACLIATAVGIWAQGPRGASMGSLALAVFLLERSQQPPWVRQLWYGLILCFCVAYTTYYVQRALAGSAA